MIYTITCNPALDCTIKLGEWRDGAIHDSEGRFSPGGKGVNVSRILTALGVENCALGFVAGDRGRSLEQILQKMGVKTDFIHLTEGETRINMKICGPTERERNGTGAPVSAEALEQLEQQLSQLTPTDVVCLCGSMPPQMPTDTYGRLIDRLQAQGVNRIVLDTSGEALAKAIAHRPWLVKPNWDELTAVVGRELPTLSDVMTAADELRDRGAQNVLVSLGGGGAVLCTADGARLFQETPHGRVIGTVGAGDSLVAGFVSEYLRTEDCAAALRFGVACGSATAFAEDLATKADVEEVLPSVPELRILK